MIIKFSRTFVRSSNCVTCMCVMYPVALLVVYQPHSRQESSSLFSAGKPVAFLIIIFLILFYLQLSGMRWWPGGAAGDERPEAGGHVGLRGPGHQAAAQADRHSAIQPPRGHRSVASEAGLEEAGELRRDKEFLEVTCSWRRGSWPAPGPPPRAACLRGEVPGDDPGQQGCMVAWLDTMLGRNGSWIE